MSGLTALGLFVVFIGLGLAYYGRNKSGSMDIDIGKFKGPAWFLLIIFGAFLCLLDYGWPLLFH